QSSRHTHVTTYSYTLSLHDALPIYQDRHVRFEHRRSRPRVCEIIHLLCGKATPCPAECQAHPPGGAGGGAFRAYRFRVPLHGVRSEEHTSELQSRENLVCRLLLDKK